MPGSNNEHDVQPLSQKRAREISHQFPGNLDEAGQQQVAQRIERLFAAIETLREFPLENGDEPAPVFRPIGKELS